MDNATAIASIVSEHQSFEKHFTLGRNGGGPDDSFSLEPAELTALCQDARLRGSHWVRLTMDASRVSVAM